VSRSFAVPTLLAVALVAGCSAHADPVLCGRGDPPPTPQVGCAPDGGERIVVRSPSFEPHDALASPETLVGTWECGGGVKFDYRSGISITQVSGAGIRHPERAWHRMSDESREDDVADIDGVPAYVASPGPCVLGVVTLVRGGLLINVMGTGTINADDLKRVAASLRAPTP
jgi:hypothetical protein